MKRIGLSLTAFAAALCVLGSIPAPAGAVTERPAIAPNPVISRNVPAYSGTSTNPSAGNDDFYYTFWMSAAPDYLAYDLSGVPEAQRKQVMAVWYNTSSYDSIGQYISCNAEPVDYTIEVNAAPGGSYPADGWVVADTVTDNGLSSRQHLVDMEGYQWIRIAVSKATSGNVSMNFDIHNVSDGVTDSWLFLGDSITAGGMPNCYGTGYAAYVNQLDDRFYPIAENGGIGGICSIHGVENIDRWLSTYPGKYVSIAYGTNDAWGNQTGGTQYGENTKYMIDAILAAGKTPVLPTIPYSTNPDVGSYLPDYNDAILGLYAAYGSKLIQGPDFYAFFEANPDLLGGDGVHPSSEGYDAMRQLWAETMYRNVYTAQAAAGLTGDVSGDGTCGIADVIMLQKWLVRAGDLTTPTNADCNADGTINAFDLCLLKQQLGVV